MLLIALVAEELNFTRNNSFYNNEKKAEHCSAFFISIKLAL